MPTHYEHDVSLHMNIQQVTTFVFIFIQACIPTIQNL
jgi:hypothetical protein